MNLLKGIVLSEMGGSPSNPQEVVNAISKALVGKKITAFGPKGKGLWGEHPEVQTYQIKKVVGHFMKGEMGYGNLDIHLNGYDSHGGKVKDKYGHTEIVGGMIYTDKTFLAHLKQLLAGTPAMACVKSLDYSEQGMQGRNHVNLDIEFKKFPKVVKEGKDEVEHIHAHKVGDEIEWDEEHGDPENGPTGHLSTASGTVTKLHPKGYMVKRHDSFSGDDKDQLIHHNWARKMEHPLGYYEESACDYDIHVKKIPGGIFSQVKMTREIVHTKHPELKKRYGTKGDVLTTDMVNRMKAKGYKVKEDGGAYEGEYRLLETVDSVYSRLLSIAKDVKDISKSEEEMTKRYIKDMQTKGWTDDEIVSCLRNMEHINPDIEEDRALNRMADITKKVEARLKTVKEAKDADKKVGDRIRVKAHKVLGTPAAMGTIRKVEKNHYIVHIDGDGEEWDGPVSFDGEVLAEAKKPAAKKDPSSVILDIAVQGGDHDMGTDADTIKWAKKYNCTAKKLRANGPGGGWTEWKFTGEPKDIRRLVTNYDGGLGEVEYLLGHKE